jgi:hypothetical protein
MFVAVLSTYENHVLIVLYNKTKYVQEVQNNIVGSTYSLQKQSLLMYILCITTFKMRIFYNYFSAKWGLPQS